MRSPGAVERPPPTSTGPTASLRPSASSAARRCRSRSRLGRSPRGLQARKPPPHAHTPLEPLGERRRAPLQIALEAGALRADLEDGEPTPPDDPRQAEGDDEPCG